MNKRRIQLLEKRVGKLEEKVDVISVSDYPGYYACLGSNFTHTSVNTMVQLLMSYLKVELKSTQQEEFLAKIEEKK